jgi:flavin reductase (DIM6/NTAB) family NADH-FMN oxidoreductase RutF
MNGKNVKKIESIDISKMESRFRASFINSLGGFKSVILIGTKNKNGQENLAIFNSLIHLGANPALCAFIVRPDLSPRHTLENILETKFYTINHLNENIYKAAHQSSARYPKEKSEFEAVGLKSEQKDTFFAPFVKDSLIKFGCEFVQKIPIELNGTTLIIGKIIEIYIPENCIGKDGFVDIEQAGTLTVSGLDSYHSTKKIARLSYAKPDLIPTELIYQKE